MIIRRRRTDNAIPPNGKVYHDLVSRNGISVSQISTDMFHLTFPQSFITHHRVCNKIYTGSTTIGIWTAFPSVWCFVNHSTSFSPFGYIWPLYFLCFDLRYMIISFGTLRYCVTLHMQVISAVMLLYISGKFTIGNIEIISFIVKLRSYWSTLLMSMCRSRYEVDLYVDKLSFPRISYTFVKSGFSFKTFCYCYWSHIFCVADNLC